MPGEGLDAPAGEVAARRLRETLVGGASASGEQGGASEVHGRHLRDYYLARFYTEASAQLFEPLRRACDEANAAKRQEGGG